MVLLNNKNLRHKNIDQSSSISTSSYLSNKKKSEFLWNCCFQDFGALYKKIKKKLNSLEMTQFFG